LTYWFILKLVKITVIGQSPWSLEKNAASGRCDLE